MKFGFRAHDGDKYLKLTDRDMIPKNAAWCNIRNCQGIPRSEQDAVRELHNLNTPEKIRMNGLASKLLKGICEEATQSGILLLLLVSQENKDYLIRFYKKFGFAVIQDDDSCVMIRNPVGDVCLNG